MVATAIAAVLVPKVPWRTMPDDALLTTPITDLDERYAGLRIAQPRHQAAMAASMRRFGQISPVVATRSEDALVLVDGFKRLAAARTLGLGALSVRELVMTSRAAIAAIYGLNRGGRGLLDLEEAMVVRELVRTQGLSQPEVGELLGRHKSWVSRRLALVERLCDEVQDDVRVGLLRPTVAREVARLPRGNQPEVAAAIQRHGLTSRQATQLVTLFGRSADRREQRQFLDDPRAALDAHGLRSESPGHDLRLSSRANELRREALHLTESAARMARHLTEVGVGTLSAVERELLGGLLRRARDAVNPLAVDLTATLDALLTADGS